MSDEPAAAERGPHAKIIKAFDSIRALAKAVGAPASTVGYWSATGLIPARWHSKVLGAAQRLKLPITAADFVTSDEPSNDHQQAKVG